MERVPAPNLAKQETKRDVDVLFVIASMVGGGAQRVVSVIANCMAAEGFHVVILTTCDALPSHFPLRPEVMLRALPQARFGFAGSIRGNWTRIRGVRAIVRELAPRAVVSFIAPTNVLTVIATMGLPPQVVISERNDPARQSFGLVWDNLRCWLYRFADVVTANTSGALRHMNAYVPLAKLRLLPNPLPADQSKGLEIVREKVVLAVGRLHVQKAHDVLLHAFAKFLKEKPDWRLVVAGDGPLKSELKSLARSLGIADRVDLLGSVDDTTPLYRRAKIFAMPSRHEGMPNAMLEAMALGCACIVSDASPGPLEYVEHLVTGIVVKAEDADQLAGWMIKVAGDGELRDSLVAAARQRVAGLQQAEVLRVWKEVCHMEGRESNVMACSVTQSGATT